MSEIFLHGAETKESDAGNPRYVNTIDTGIIQLVGTAPQRNKTKFPPNQPFVAHGYDDLPKGLGSTGTVVDGLSNIFAQSGRMSPTVVCNIVEEGANYAEFLANLIGSQVNKTGLFSISRAQEFNLKPKMIIGPGGTSIRPTTGVNAINLIDGGDGYTTAPNVVITRKSGDTTGVLASASCTINESGEVDEVYIDNPGHLYSAAPDVSFVSVDGNGTGASATTTLGQVANPTASTLTQICNRYRAMTAVTGPNTTAQAAVDYRLDFDSDRLYIIDPMVKVQKAGVPVSMPAESLMVGLQARIDYEEGFWVSPSNHVLEGVLGTHRPIEHSESDRSVESQYLNKNHVGTVVRKQTGGWKLFGNRVAKSDPLKVFWSVRRSHDVMIESIELASEPYKDKPFSIQNLVDIAETVNRALRRWEALGATLGGRVWLDPILNSEESLSSGILYIHYDGEGPAPMEHLIFVFNRNTGYYRTVLQSASQEIARRSAAGVI